MPARRLDRRERGCETRRAVANNHQPMRGFAHVSANARRNAADDQVNGGKSAKYSGWAFSTSAMKEGRN